MWYERFWLWAKEHLTITVPGVVLVLAAVYVLMLAVQAGAAGAAWVQAFGSIGAILAATFIASEGRRVERARERKKEAVICLALLYKVEEAKALMIWQSLTLARAFDDIPEISAADRAKAIQILEEQIRKLRAVSLESLPDPRLVNALSEIISEFLDASLLADAPDLDDYICMLHNRDEGPFSENINAVEERILLIRDFAGVA